MVGGFGIFDFEIMGFEVGCREHVVETVCKRAGTATWTFGIHAKSRRWIAVCRAHYFAHKQYWYAFGQRVEIAHHDSVLLRKGFEEVFRLYVLYCAIFLMCMHEVRGERMHSRTVDINIAP